MLVEKYRPRIAVAFTRDAALWKVLADYRSGGEHLSVLLAIPTPGFDTREFGTTLAVEPKIVDMLPYLSGESETLRFEEYAARQQGGIVANVMARLHNL